MMTDYEVHRPLDGDGSVVGGRDSQHIDRQEDLGHSTNAAVTGVTGGSPLRLDDAQDDGGRSGEFVRDAGRSARLLSPTGNDGSMQILGPPAYFLARPRSHRRGSTRHGETHRLNNRPVRKSEL
jgi:hypothetical protein